MLTCIYCARIEGVGYCPVLSPSWEAYNVSILGIVWLFAWTTDHHPRLILVPQPAYSTLSRGVAWIVYLPGSWLHSARLCQAVATAWRVSNGS